MKEISSGVAFWILDAWRRIPSQLQLSSFGENLISGSRTVVRSVKPSLSMVSLVKEVAAGQNGEWNLSLGDCKFWFGVPEESSPLEIAAGGKWLSFLVIELPVGKRLVLGEIAE